MSQLSQGYQALYIAHEYLAVMKYCLIALGGAHAVTEMTTLIALSRSMRYSCRRTVRGNARCPHFPLAIISVTVQLWIQVFWVISVQFNIRNTLPKFRPILLGHPVYHRFLRLQKLVDETECTRKCMLQHLPHCRLRINGENVQSLHD